MSVVRWFHLIAASIWVGGLFTLGVIVATLRTHGVARPVLQAVARRFGRLSWGAMAVAVLSGGWMAIDYIDQPILAVKMGLVAITAGLAGWHQFAAKNQSPKMRGILQALILISSLAVVAAAIAL